MPGRRKRWLTTALLLAIVAAMGWAATRRAPKIALELSFAGYTNTAMTYSIGAIGGPTNITMIVETAHVLVKNSSAVTIKLDTRRGEKELCDV